MKKFNQFVHEAILEEVGRYGMLADDDAIERVYQAVRRRLELHQLRKDQPALLIEDPTPIEFIREMLATSKRSKREMKNVGLILAGCAYHESFLYDRLEN